MLITNQSELDAAAVGTLARHPLGPVVHVALRDDGARFCYVNGVRQLHWGPRDFPLEVMFDPAVGIIDQARSARELAAVLLVDDDPTRPVSPGLVRSLAQAITNGWPPADGSPSR